MERRSNWFSWSPCAIGCRVDECLRSKPSEADPGEAPPVHGARGTRPCGSIGVVPADFRPWIDAWVQSAYAESGFWTRSSPGEHFRTASTVPEVLAEAVLGVLPQGCPVSTVVELGAGDGQLLSALARRRPDLELVGVDLRVRPDRLDRRVGWRQDLWDVSSDRWRTGAADGLLEGLSNPTLIVCVEWLDDLPCVVAHRKGETLREVEVDHTGRERLGAPLFESDRAWADRWWRTGDRLEIGGTRDRAWAAALRHLRRNGGFALAIDYGHRAVERPRQGSLTAYADGRRRAPVPTTEVNLTAAVAIDALADAGLNVGARTLLCSSQREVLTARPAAAPRADPLADLVRRSERAALADPAVWGDQWWLLQQVPAAS
jgi:hypothetical protein